MFVPYLIKSTLLHKLHVVWTVLFYNIPSHVGSFIRYLWFVKMTKADHSLTHSWQYTIKVSTLHRCVFWLSEHLSPFACQNRALSHFMLYTCATSQKRLKYWSFVKGLLLGGVFVKVNLLSGRNTKAHIIASEGSISHEAKGQPISMFQIKSNQVLF